MRFARPTHDRLMSLHEAAHRPRGPAGGAAADELEPPEFPPG